VDSSTVFVVDFNNNLWLEIGPFGLEIPPPRVPVDGNVDYFVAIHRDEVYVVGLDGNLWLERAPFGVVPLPACSQTSLQGCRQLIASNVLGFEYLFPLGGLFVLYNELWQLGTPNVKIDENVQYFWPLSSEQTFTTFDTHTSPAAQTIPAKGLIRPFGRRRSLRRLTSNRSS
jgi:hypothetical protein